MAQQRPYLSLEVSRLSKLVNRSPRDKDLLEAVEYELSFRKSGASKQLRRRVEQLLLQSDADNKVTSDPDPEPKKAVETFSRAKTVENKTIETSSIMSDDQNPQTVETFLNTADPFVLDSLEVMRKKLLDLTARNRLLNFPIHQAGSALRIIDEIPDQIYDELLSDSPLKFKPVPPPTREQLIEHGYLEVDEETGEEKQLKPNPDAREWAKVLGFDVGYELPRTEDASGDDKHQDDAIQVLLYPPEMESRLRGIRGKAQTAIEEMGASILYLALGFLEWSEKDDSSKTRLAPLFTVPVHLSRGKLDHQTGTYQYTLQHTGEDILPNLSLKEKLALDFGLGLPEVEDDVSPEEYLDKVEELISRTKPNWKVRRYGALALLNFGKMLMYLDLDPNRWPCDDRNLVKHPIVRRFFTSSENDAQGQGGNASEYLIDEIDEIHEVFPLIDDADSSQHSALIDAVNGENLVVEGPPGTGKSQTITNLIAAAMLTGKKVLFVAEKMAALDVVKSRLDKAGLGDFCLELHSHKSQKRKVLEDIGARVVKQKHLRSTRTIDAEIERYEDYKQRLNRYANEINEPWGQTGRTIHEIFSGAARYRQALSINPTDIHIEGLSGHSLTEAKLLQLGDHISEFQKIYREMRQQVGEDANLYEHPWSGVENTSIQLFDSERIVEVLGKWQNALEGLRSSKQDIAQKLDFDLADLAHLEDCDALARDLADLPALSSREQFQALEELDGETIAEVEEQLRSHQRIQETYERLPESVNGDQLQSLSEGQALPAFADLSRLSGAGQEDRVNELVQATIKLQQVEGELQALYSQLEELKAALPDHLSQLIAPNIEGLTASIELIDLVSRLKPALIPIRSEHFDEEEIEAAFDDLKTDLRYLLPLRETTESTFVLGRLPDSRELNELHGQVTRSGLGKWFSGDWYKARKRLKQLSNRPNAKPSELQPALCIFRPIVTAHSV